MLTKQNHDIDFFCARLCGYAIKNFIARSVGNMNLFSITT